MLFGLYGTQTVSLVGSRCLVHTGFAFEVCYPETIGGPNQLPISSPLCTQMTHFKPILGPHGHLGVLSKLLCFKIIEVESSTLNTPVIVEDIFELLTTMDLRNSDL